MAKAIPQPAARAMLAALREYDAIMSEAWTSPDHLPPAAERPRRLWLLARASIIAAERPACPTPSTPNS